MSGARILCVGDVMLDHYVYGQVERVSPEAPIPVLRIERETETLGGAGNVLRNLYALGAYGTLVSVLGKDEPARILHRLVAELGESESHLLVGKGRQTTVKTRYVAAGQQMLRADRETVVPLDKYVRADLLRIVEQALPQHDLLVLSDYAKGVLGDGVGAALIAVARAAGKPVVVDPKGTDFSIYRGADLVKPNRRELALATRLPVGTETEVVAAAQRLIESCDFGAVLVSLSQDGMILVERQGEGGREGGGAAHALPAAAREVFDVSGAGDTVIATLAAALASGHAAPEAARLANLAAGIVVGKVGTAIVSAAELADAAAEGSAGLAGKVQPLERAEERVERWRQRGFKIGFTNGCFDLLHPGHVFLLEQARAACDRLVVGLNSDASVKRLKGESRPVQHESARAAVLASLAAVDLVVIFAEDTPEALIQALRPDVLVKGADYTIEQVVGADLVQSWGGKVVLAELKPGHSTTATIRRIGTR